MIEDRQMYRKTFTSRNPAFDVIFAAHNETAHVYRVIECLTKVATVKLFLYICLPYYMYGYVFRMRPVIH